MASVFCLSLGLKAGQPLPPTRPLDATKPTDISKAADSKRWKTGFIITLKGDTIMGGYYHQSDPGIIIQSDPPKLSTRLIA